ALAVGETSRSPGIDQIQVDAPVPADIMAAESDMPSNRSDPADSTGIPVTNGTSRSLQLNAGNDTFPHSVASAYVPMVQLGNSVSSPATPSGFLSFDHLQALLDVPIPADTTAITSELLAPPPGQDSTRSGHSQGNSSQRRVLRSDIHLSNRRAVPYPLRLSVPHTTNPLELTDAEQTRIERTHGGRQTLLYIAEHAHELTDHLQRADIVKIAANNGGAQALQAVLTHRQALIDAGFSNDDIVNIAAHDGGSRRLTLAVGETSRSP
ncbi:TAL effector repeat-containing protein, partial [Burkholderia sp. Bp8986]|uniref:TAL effector repeat-containing protein n=1 Tax=Burkholderia sp. Bp8986 TaxID=2184550 RepID=UPI00163B46DE